MASNAADAVRSTSPLGVSDFKTENDRIPPKGVSPFLKSETLNFFLM
jgi:hypothetical protein